MGLLTNGTTSHFELRNYTVVFTDTRSDIIELLDPETRRLGGLE